MTPKTTQSIGRHANRAQIERNVLRIPSVKTRTPPANANTLQTKPPRPNIDTKRHLGNTRQFRAELRDFARQLGRNHAERWERDPRKARELAVQCFRKYLPHARLGRPRSADVTRALELRQQGKRWPEIYGELISDRDPDRRIAKRLRLRAAVRARLRYGAGDGLRRSLVRF
jgi:hypothetical protein